MKTKTVELFFLIASVFLLAACSAEVNGVPEPQASSESSIEAGHRLMAAAPLRNFYQRSYAGRLPNTEENLIKWIQNPQRFDPGNAMPDLGVKEEEARAMAEYLYHQPNLLELLRR